ncbi:DUF5672 family protein [Segatella buccae]|uniref:DUF5672 family protein n=1 Tax=Segatella buccae TaxID=28126 RepID=UPI0028D169F5|nr:DUF5672 family protein [Segatella buccae]
MAHKNVLIIIPVYRPELKSYEAAALANNLEKLAGYPAVFLKPAGLDLGALRIQYPQVGEAEVSPQWLGTARGIAGYNEMMMSADFYSLFNDYEYILICHVDAWVFRDELDDWCRRGYDHVAAPWPTRKRYTRFPLKQYLWLKLRLKPAHKILHCQMFGRIGNGGFSLRRVSVFRDACLKYADEIARFNAQEHVLYNEDLFWALIPQELRLPTVPEALKFSFDLKPRLCYEQNGRQLPMACHGFNKPMRADFWRQFLPPII